MKKIALALVLCLFLFSQGEAHQHGGGQFGSVPPAAAAVGYNTLTYSSTFSGDIDLSQTYASGFNWYVWDWFGGSVSPSTIVPFSGGVTLTGATAGPNGTMATAADPLGGNFVGTVFGGGLYIEAKIQFDPSQVNAGTQGWPSFWSLSLEQSLGTSQWPGQATGYTTGVEADFMEFERPISTTGYGGTIHQAYGKFNITCPPNYCQYSPSVGSPRIVNPNTDFSRAHVYGWLWVPATVTTNGYIKFYFDGQQIGPATAWTQFVGGAGQIPPPDNQPWAFGSMDTQHYFIILGTGPSQPMVINYVNVWQLNANNNITH